MNKKRTIVTIIGVILSTALMVGIGLLLSTLRENAVDEVIQSNGYWHATLKDVPYEKINLVKQNNTVENVFVLHTIGYANFLKDTDAYLRVENLDQAALQELKLTNGRLPKTSNEIVLSSDIIESNMYDFKVGDTITLGIGEFSAEEDEAASGTTQSSHEEEEKREFLEKEQKTYTIVGSVHRSYFENQIDYGSVVYTTGDFQQEDLARIYITYHKGKNTFEYTDSILKNLGMDSSNVEYNDSLLALSGVSVYSNFIGSLAGVLVIVLSLVSIGCIIVIYNSFAISVMERKKQFGLFSSIGATKSQLRKTVFFEAFLVAIIGIPLGILGSYLGIGIVIMIINKLLPNVFAASLKLCTYPLFIIIPIIFMVVTIFVSAFLPARRASRITPIEAIRQNDDIKIKKRQLKSGKIVRKIFGIEGSLAHKNMKRNKRKYRITVASLVISIVLFVSFSSLMGYVLESTDSYLGLLDFDILISDYDATNDQSALEKIKNHDQVDAAHSYRFIGFETDSKFSYTDEMEELFQISHEGIQGVNLLVMSDDDFASYSKKIGNSSLVPVLLNTYSGMVYEENSRKFYSISKYKEEKHEVPLCNLQFSQETGDFALENCTTKITDYVLSKEPFLGISDFASYDEPMFIIRESDLSTYAPEGKIKTRDSGMTLIQAKHYDRLNPFIEELYQKGEMSGYWENLTEDTKLMHNFSIVAKLLVYGFISLVTLIGVTSVFNTIHTSISLRRKEFAMLRSMGLTPRGMNKMLYMESLFVGLKSLFIGLPLAFGVIVLLHLSFSGIVSFETILIPWKNIAVAIVGVFIIVLLTMMYASRKIKKENILEAIREENI